MNDGPAQRYFQDLFYSWALARFYFMLTGDGKKPQSYFVREGG